MRVNINAKKFEELNFKLIIYTRVPSKVVSVVNFQKEFNSITKTYLNEDISVEACNNYVSALEQLMLEKTDILKENNADEIITKAQGIIDYLKSVYDILVNGVPTNDVSSNSVPQEDNEKINSVVASQRRNAATRLFAARCKSVEDFDSWFNALIDMRAEMQELYRTTVYSDFGDMTKWDENTWFLHTAFLMFCNASDKDVEEYARDYWNRVMELEDCGICHIRENPFGVIHSICLESGADKDYVMSSVKIEL